MMTREEAALEVVRREAVRDEQEEEKLREQRQAMARVKELATKARRRERRDAARSVAPMVPLPGDALSPLQQAFLTALLGTPIPAAAARAVGITPVTGSAYLKQPAFAAAYRQAVAAHQEAARQKLATLTGTAIERLEGLLDDDDPGIRIKAVDLALKWGLPAKAAPASRDSPGAMKITEIVVHLPQAAPAPAELGDRGAGDRSAALGTANIIEGEMREPPDSAWGSLQVVVRGEADS